MNKKPFGIWNLILLVPTIIFLIVAVIRQDYWLLSYTILIGLSELLMGVMGLFMK
jgi:hypothetical protein